MTAPTICAIIVTYNPAESLLENIAALRSQVSSLVIVDNGSSESGMESIREASRRYECEIISNGRNLGIAAALNIGVRYAISQDCNWIALFDQDSTVVGSFIAQMLCTYANSEIREQIAIITPRYIDRVTSTPMGAITDRSGNILASMTSGSLMPVNVFRQCGEFDELLFMDYVDHEFCLRVRGMGFVIVQSEAVLLHSLGAMTFHRFLGKNLVTSNHRAARRYYITRNRIWLYKKYIWKDFPWTVKNAWGLTRETVKVLLLEQDRALKLRNTLLGIGDALSGSMGYRMPL